MWHRWNDRTFVYAYGGIYGRFLSDFLARQSEAFAFVDVGANQGLYSLVAAQNPHCRKVVAFEPVAATFAAFKANLAINPGTNKVEALQLGISDRAERRAIHIPPGHSGMATLREGDEAVGPAEMIELISASELDGLLPDGVPLVVKVDVEGHEPIVIEQLLKCRRASQISCIFYEVDTRWSDATQIERVLRSEGFDDFRRVGRGHHFDVMARRSPAVRPQSNAATLRQAIPGQ
jgi:FkbM family methyltransferase